MKGNDMGRMEMMWDKRKWLPLQDICLIVDGREIKGNEIGQKETKWDERKWCERERKQSRMKGNDVEQKEMMWGELEWKETK